MKFPFIIFCLKVLIYNLMLHYNISPGRLFVQQEFFVLPFHTSCIVVVLSLNIPQFLFVLCQHLLLIPLVFLNNTDCITPLWIIINILYHIQVNVLTLHSIICNIKQVYLYKCISLSEIFSKSLERVCKPKGCSKSA